MSDVSGVGTVYNVSTVESKPYLLFDYSGTLADERHLVWDVTNQLHAHFKIPAITYDEWSKVGAANLMGYLKARLPLVTINEQTAMNLFHVFYRDAKRRLGQPKLIPGVVDCLKTLYGRGYRIGVISSHPHEFLREELRAFGMSSYLDFMVGSLIDKRTAIAHFMLLHRLQPSQVAYIGDTVSDMYAALNTGVVGYAVLTGYNSYNMFKDVASKVSIMPTLDVLLNVYK